ncbi:MAG: hypothetical protein KY462_08260 [Actinobacteria bacterium]|nr:hypothetical protein [Actinomycetota bacterium]
MSEGLWGDVIGQPAATAALRAAVAAGSVAHAWLLVGPPGVGQPEAVAALAADLNCLHAHPYACATCGTCRRIRRRAHPALRDLEPEGAFHVVDAVRDEWIPTATSSLLDGRVKVLRVVEADRMHDATQNAFLKLLEEPPPSVVWVLEVADDAQLLRTIVSRCRRLDFVQWGRDDLAARAVELEIGERSADLVRAAMGSPARLEELHDPDVAAARDRHLGVVGRLADEGPAAAVPATRELTDWSKRRARHQRDRNARDRARLEEAYGGEWPAGAKTRRERRERRLEREGGQAALRTALADLAAYLRDLIAVAGGADAADLVNRDHREALSRDAARVSVAVAVDGLQAVADCLDALEHNGQPDLHVERLLLRLSVPLQQSASQELVRRE